MKIIAALVYVVVLTLSTQCQPSPEGKIVFISEFGDRKWKICTIDSDGKNENILTPDSGKYSLPSWSADGKQIVFYSSINAGYNIFIMNDDGTWSLPGHQSNFL